MYHWNTRLVRYSVGYFCYFYNGGLELVRNSNPLMQSVFVYNLYNVLNIFRRNIFSYFEDYLSTSVTQPSTSRLLRKTHSGHIWLNFWLFHQNFVISIWSVIFLFFHLLFSCQLNFSWLFTRYYFFLLSHSELKQNQCNRQHLFSNLKNDKICHTSIINFVWKSINYSPILN